MRASTFGMALTILGIMMIIYTGIDFIRKKRVVDIGPIKIEKEKPIQWPPIVGVILTVGGIGLVLRNRKEKYRRIK